MQLIVRRVQATALENMLYPDEDLVETALCPLSEARGQDHIAGTGEDNSTEDDVADNNNQQSITSPHNDNESLPNTRAKARATALQLRENPAARAPRKKKKSKSTPPTSITQVGTYIRATNVFFDQLHQADVSSLGEPPTMREPTYHLPIYCEPTYHLPFHCEPTYRLPIYCASIHHAYCSPLYHASTDFYFHTVQVLSSLQPPTLSSSTAIMTASKFCCRCLELLGTMCTDLFGATAPVVKPNRVRSTAPNHEQSGST